MFYLFLHLLGYILYCQYFRERAADNLVKVSMTNSFKEYALIKVNNHKSHLMHEVNDLEGFGAATITLEMKE